MFTTFTMMSPDLRIRRRGAGVKAADLCRPRQNPGRGSVGRRASISRVAGDGQLEVIPAVRFDVAGLGIQRAAGFDAVPRVAPAADVPPSAVFVAVDAEQNQEAFRAGNLPRLERERVIRPRLVAGKRADEFLLRRLPQGAVLPLHSRRRRAISSLACSLLKSDGTKFFRPAR